MLTFDNLPSKRYVVDEVAKKYNVRILRLVERFQNIIQFDNHLSKGYRSNIVCSMLLN